MVVVHVALVFGSINAHPKVGNRANFSSKGLFQQGLLFLPPTSQWARIFNDVANPGLPNAQHTLRETQLGTYRLPLPSHYRGAAVLATCSLDIAGPGFGRKLHALGTVAVAS